MTALPYRDFNAYLRDRFGERVQKIIVDAGLDCPNRDGTVARGGCIYCNRRGSGTGNHAKGLSITEQIRVGSRFVARRYKARKFLIYFQSFSNTYAPVPVLRRLYDEALGAVPGIVGLSIGTRPDCVDKAVLDLLEDYGRRTLMWVEYGLQSAHDETLRRINRGHDVACFRRAAAETRRRGIRVCAHVILGLPGESRGEMMETAKALAEMGIDAVKIHLLYVVRGTALERMYRTGAYQCLTQSEYVDLVCEFLEHLPPKVVIQRLTGDPHPDELVAPDWARDRSTLNRIRETLTAAHRFQGGRYGG
ncbi:MAG: TIGR01212 family radical SAM protein [Desulfococcus multivorans]|jgi:radical SAM protein (TIGR01212 family)|uniref:TIGR01212 family radical SAM protein n=1 Tax=Desulfococcus sp. TaxID=2025834 RepID=UPI002A3ECA77|nr:TIGR01212 family radical SAM protein [Desulfococcus multivorans]